MKPKAIAERGSVFIIALLLIIVMIVVGAPILFRLSAQYRTTDKSFKSLAAMNLAEAGVERAIWELNYGDISTWEGDSNLRTLTLSATETGTGEILISVQNPESSNPVVESTGRIPYIGGLTIDKTIRVILEGGEGSSIFDYGIFGSDGVHLDSNAKIDSFDSREGSYGGDNVGAQGHVGTNATHYGCISMDSNAKIWGNVLSGPDSDPEDVIVTNSNATIFGEKQALTEIKEFPAVSPPVGLPFMGDYFLDGNSEEVLNTSGEYSSFRLDSNSQVTITSDVTLYVSGEFSMKSNTKLIIADGVLVTLYLGGSFEQDSNTRITNLSEDASSLQIYAVDGFEGGMVWNSNSAFWGAVYAPQSDVLFNSNSDFYGSIVAAYIDMDSNGKIHYDEALKDVTFAAGESSSFVVKSWQEKASE